MLTARWLAYLLLSLWLALPLRLFADSPQQTVHVMDVFVRDGCPHCAAAKAYLPELAAQRGDLEVRLHSVDKDPNAREALENYSRMAGIWPPGVPTFVVQGRILVGFDNAENMAPELHRLIDNTPVPAAGIELPLLGRIDADQTGLVLFTLAVGLVDGFNPCAMWVLLFLLSLLVHLRDRRRMALIAGTFVFASGAVYFAFMAAWLNIFQWVGLSGTLRWILALLALVIGIVNINDFFRHGQHFSLSIPASFKPGLYARMRRIIQSHSLLPALVSVVILALLVNTIELLCTAGFPALYTAILTQQHLSMPAYYGYLGLYILAYIADDSVMVAIAVLALSSNKLSPNSGRYLKLISGVVMAGLGVTLALQPDWLY